MGRRFLTVKKVHRVEHRALSGGGEPSWTMSCLKSVARILAFLMVSNLIPPALADASLDYLSAPAPGKAGSATIGAAPAAKASNKSTPDWQEDVEEGDRLLSSKELARAQVCYERAYEKLARTKPCRDADQFAMVIQKLADVLYSQDKVDEDETIPLYKKALKVLENAYGKESSKLVATLLSLGAVYEGEGDYRKAEKRYRRADRIAAAARPGQNTLIYAGTQHRMARAHSKMARFRDAESEYFASLKAIMSQEKLPSSAFLEEVTNDYINLLRQYEGYAKTLNSSFQSELLKDRIDDLPRKRGVPQSNWHSAVSARLADQAASRVLNEGGDHPKIAPPAVAPPCANRSAPGRQDAQIDTNKRFSDFAALESSGQQRISFYQRMIAADIDALGREHPSVARDLTGLASIYILQGNYDVAKPLLARSVEIYQKVYQGDSAPAKQARRLLAVIAEEQNPATISLDSGYLEHLPRIPVEAQKLEIAYELNDLAFMLCCQGKIERSLEVYYWALASTAAASGATSLLSAACMSDFGRLLRLSGKNQQAEQFEGNARAIVRRNFLTIHKNTWKY